MGKRLERLISMCNKARLIGASFPFPPIGVNLKTSALHFLTGIFVATALSGCVTTLVGGVMENSIEVTVDESNFPPAARDSLRKARNLGFVSMDSASIKAADLFETRGGYIVKIDRQAAKAGEMTGSERREALSNLCKTPGIEIAMLGRIVKTESGSMVAAAFTGRAKVDQNWVMDMFECKTRASNTFGGALRMNLGMFNNKSQQEFEELIGAEIGSKILASIGRDKTGAPIAAEASPVAKPTSANQERPVQQSASPSIPPTDSKAMSITEMQKALLSLKYQAGSPDGVMGRRTVDALKKFQSDNGLPQTGQLNLETQSKLIDKSGIASK